MKVFPERLSLVIVCYQSETEEHYTLLRDNDLRSSIESATNNSRLISLDQGRQNMVFYSHELQFNLWVTTPKIAIVAT
jgi:hypothetical protein